MQRVYQAVQAVADSNATVLVRGESGTGKETGGAGCVRVRRPAGINLHLSELFGDSRKSDRVRNSSDTRKAHLQGLIPPRPG
jgi:hypothetical protein